MASQQKQSKLILYLVIVLGFIAGYYYNTSFNSPEAIPLPEGIAQKKESVDGIASFKDLKIDFSILDNDRYKKLQIYGEQPVDPGQTGKRDLFAP